MGDVVRGWVILDQGNVQDHSFARTKRGAQDAGVFNVFGDAAAYLDSPWKCAERDHGLRCVRVTLELSGNE